MNTQDPLAHPLAALTSSAFTPLPVDVPLERRGRAFIAFHDWTTFTRQLGEAPHSLVMTSPLFDTDLAANEIVVSWNAATPAGTGLKIEARAFCGDHLTRFYTLGLWSKDAGSFPRQSVNGQKDADGDVRTDTLALTHPASQLQLRITLYGKADGKSNERLDEKLDNPSDRKHTAIADNKQADRPEVAADQENSPPQMPILKYLGVCLADTHFALTPLEPNRNVWGKEIAVPAKTQLGWPGGSGWCSPTSTSMTLAFWAKLLHRPELDIPVPDTARAIYDKVYDGTGNWPFNTAFAGSFPSMRAYVTRLSDIRELEDWIAVGIPTVVAVSYDLLKGKLKDEDPGHLMVCDGFTKEGDIVLNDPAHHPEKGEVCRRVFPRANFLRGWNRSKFLVYLIYPENTILPKDNYGHWDSVK